MLATVIEHGVWLHGGPIYTSSSVAVRGLSPRAVYAHSEHRNPPCEAPHGLTPRDKPGFLLDGGVGSITLAGSLTHQLIPTPAIETPGRRRGVHRVSPNLTFLVCFILLLLGIFTLMRTGLVLSNWTPGLATGAEMARAYWVGLRFDLAISAYMAAPVIGLCFIPFTSLTDRYA